jgi:hypothetical protein
LSCRDNYNRSNTVNDLEAKFARNYAHESDLCIHGYRLFGYFL